MAARPIELRGVVSRVLKLARTTADLAGEERIAVPHLAEALHYRSWGLT